MSDTALTKAHQRKERMLGSEALIRALEAEGVEICWGIPGGAILPLYDAFMAIDHSIELAPVTPLSVHVTVAP